MDRSEYLNDENVAGFVQWLRQVIVVEHGFTQSFVTNNGRGKVVDLNGFRSALRAYEYGGRDVGETQIVLNRLSETIERETQEENAIPDASQQHALLIACLETLVWGGVTVKATIEWLAKRAQQGTLHQNIYVGSRALVADCLSDIEPFGPNGYLRSDSAATKIYALANPKSIIYDNRVGAALAKLVCEYLDHNNIEGLPESLSFMVKTGGLGRRNPSDMHRSFTPKVAGYSHAFWNQRANWIINDLARYDDVVQAMGVFEGVDVIRAIESALFVMGDDIRNLNVNRDLEVIQNSQNQQATGADYELIPEYINGVRFQSYCIPSTHDLSLIHI